MSFSAGGVKALGHVGVLARLREEGLLDDVTAWYGCSGGCIAALLGALGASPTWMREAIAQFDMRGMVEMDATLILQYTQRWGVNDGSTLLNWFGRLIDTWIPGCSTWTFRDLQTHCNANLTLVATNLTQGRQELFSVEHTPDVRLLDGMRGSMAVPMFFTPYVSSSGDVICDGALLEYYPWNCIGDKDSALVVVSNSSGIRGRPIGLRQIKSLSQYMSRIFELWHHTKPGPSPRYWIALNDNVAFMEFRLTASERSALVAVGEAAASQWLEFRRRQSAVEETDGNPPPCEAQSTSPSMNPYPDRTWDSRQSRNQQPLHDPPQDRYTARKRIERRWSL